MDDDDLVDTMLKKSGCLKIHHKLQECIAETKDWRKCQDILEEFKECIQTHHSNQTKK